MFGLEQLDENGSGPLNELAMLSIQAAPDLQTQVRLDFRLSLMCKWFEASIALLKN